MAETQEVYQRFLKSSRPVKELLLDQTVMTGLGNIYADEVSSFPLYIRSILLTR